MTRNEFPFVGSVIRPVFEGLPQLWLFCELCQLHHHSNVCCLLLTTMTQHLCLSQISSPYHSKLETYYLKKYSKRQTYQQKSYQI